MMEEAAGFVAAELLEHCAATVTVEVGPIAIPGVKAVRGRSEIEVEDGQGGWKIITTDRDYLFDPADLVVAGVQQLPERGWRVRDTADDAVEIYEALVPGKGRDVYTWCDEHRQALRMHCKLIKRE